MLGELVCNKLQICGQRVYKSGSIRYNIGVKEVSKECKKRNGECDVIIKWLRSTAKGNIEGTKGLKTLHQRANTEDNDRLLVSKTVFEELRGKCVG